MADGKPQKLTQEEMLSRLSEEPFNQKKCVPPDAKVQVSPEERWWRSDSPRAGEHPDVPTQETVRGAGTAGFQTQYQTGSGTAAHYKEEMAPKMISGYSGHIAGKYAGNVIGGTFDKSNADAVEHLKTTSQANRFPRPGQS
mmetsp:Transcript_102047/g.284069  ORF Transcript_102047/g.284069 Transcript_102047/m.284069 type:complete len:141 (-) Transcript_102047:143-565(-)|eukprot:CAMPEP_0179099098 /NCGR_PEP_ID=MMETSP0796-20121207/45702_1 /TAXON_ID=73915 /ORGANISM="Pyrodinium bahamense, Strain pbaha01" /LENGTH=140 /DNA_ID=CAMNT_0020796893 /DNA_START=68 /DNA_END=490 /DNA_ORIENTATION=+